MKKILLSSIAVLSFQAITAQTLTEANHAPAVGNLNYSTKQCDSLSVLPGVSGVGAVWSYTPTGYTKISNYSTSTASSPEYTMANVSVSSGTSSLAYYKASSTDLNYYGGTLSLNGQAVSLNYTTPLKAMAYPMTAVSNVTSSPTGTLSASGGALTGSFTGDAKVTADASGALNLPGRTFTDIIRTVTTQTLNATTGIGAVTVTQKIYDYYSVSASKAPIITIAFTSVVSAFGPQSQTITTVMNNYLTVGVEENSKNTIDVSVFPNPSNSFVNLSTTSLEAFKVLTYDVTGRLVGTSVFENGKSKLDVSMLNAGVYIYTIVSKNNETLKTGKFNVTK